MKIYILNAWDGDKYEPRTWIVGVFTSEEAAREYMHQFTDTICKLRKRLDELEELACDHELTEAEEKEFDDVYDELGDYTNFFKRGGKFFIKNYEIIK